MVKKKKDKRTNNDLQNTTQKTKTWAKRTSLKTGGKRGGVELMCKHNEHFSIPVVVYNNSHSLKGSLIFPLMKSVYNSNL
jgi:hypothetical protein